MSHNELQVCATRPRPLDIKAKTENVTVGGARHWLSIRVKHASELSELVENDLHFLRYGLRFYLFMASQILPLGLFSLYTAS